MNYIGSKLSLLSFIEDSIKETVGDISDKIFFDLFAGTGVVANYFNGLVKAVYANDIEKYSYILNCNYLLNKESHKVDFEWLNSLKPLKGFFWKHYSPEGGRMYFTKENAMKIDAIKKVIFYSDSVNEIYRMHFLASLIESADKVANTASVYGAYLKNFKDTALKEFILIPADFKKIEAPNKVFNNKAEYIVKFIKSDILYLDPPYNARQYGANYHILNSLVTKEEFIPQGITGLPEFYNKSDFCSKRKVKNAFIELFKNAQAKHIFLSYNNEGLLDSNALKEIMSNFGSYKLFTKEYKRYKADNKREYTADSTIEYLHYLKKS